MSGADKERLTTDRNRFIPVSGGFRQLVRFSQVFHGPQQSLLFWL